MRKPGERAADWYARRLDELARDSAIAASRARGWRIALAILVMAAAGLVYASFTSSGSVPWATVLLVPVAALLASQVGRWRDRGVELYTLAEHYRTSVARLERNWELLDAGNEFADSEHLYARDLDLFGHGSLFQLLCSTRTHAGREVLARWMTVAADPEEVIARHAASTELRARPDLRERLAAAGGTIASDCHPDTFRTWVSGTLAHRPFAVWIPPAALLLSLSALALPAMFIPGVISGPATWAITSVVLTLIAALGAACLPRVRAILREWRLPSTELAVVCELLRLLEQEEFSSPKLRALTRELTAANAYRHVRRLRRIIEWAEARDVPVFGALSHLLLWGTQWSMAVHRWHSRHGTALLTWLALIGEFEALMSLATYAGEHPDDVLPELSATGPLIHAEGMCHPLLPDAAIPNDVRLGADMPFLIVSGSNMSGKSTLLRALGLNVVLAWMGAPVRCRHLRLSQLSLGAAIRVEDSLVNGRSHFFAEVDRLRRMMDRARSLPVLFLIDEVMSGTNSHDRRIAAEWIVRAFTAYSAIGLLTTHDLALSEIATGGRGGENVHFDDSGEGGGLAFDYRLRPGVVVRSNALNIVRMLGLEPSS